MLKYNKQTKLALMGRLVAFTHEYERVETDKKNHICWKPKTLDQVKIGWVVGFRTLQNGIYSPGSSYATLEGWEVEPAYLAVTSTVPCILIATYFDSNPIRVPLEHYFQVSQIDPLKIKRPGNAWTEEYKKKLSEWSKDFPRDSKGRFSKI